MKKTKGSIAILIIVAILILGIGYAAMTANLEISGTASVGVDDANFKVIYTDVNIGDATVASKTVNPTVTSKINEKDATKAEISVSGFTSINDEVTITYTIANQSEDLNATLEATPTVTNDNEEYFQVTSSVAATSLAAKTGTTTQTVTVRCAKTPTANTETANIKVSLMASLAE